MSSSRSALCIGSRIAVVRLPFSPRATDPLPPPAAGIPTAPRHAAPWEPAAGQQRPCMKNQALSRIQRQGAPCNAPLIARLKLAPPCGPPGGVDAFIAAWTGSSRISQDRLGAPEVGTRHVNSGDCACDLEASSCAPPGPGNPMPEGAIYNRATFKKKCPKSNGN